MLFRCTLPKLALFNFEASPVLDLRVIPTKEDCIIELFSCKFKGSDVVERQNDHFSATMINHITWDTNMSEPFLEVDVKLNLCLENIHLYMFFPSKRQAQVVSYLCKQKADVGAVAMDGMGAIHFAAQKGHLEVV
uniref:Uncharacterized protein n=1 Tax=Gossypium raimondii TaxID=29730 RepID=A0A0D2Q065_GOSRA|nr:hypothetical protein B456_001G174500 [Gossypium raimondii]